MEPWIAFLGIMLVQGLFVYILYKNVFCPYGSHRTDTIDPYKWAGGGME